MVTTRLRPRFFTKTWGGVKVVLDLKTKRCLVVDNGLFSELAPRLARDFGSVGYFLPWISAYPKAAPAHIGINLAPNVERVLNLWDAVPHADIIVFPDLYFADVVDVIVGHFKKPVWAARRAEALELDRWGTRKLQKQLGLPAPRTRYFAGVDDLASYLEGCDGPCWVKISTYRGDGETWQHTSWHTTETYLNYFKQRVGGLKDDYEFLVEDHVEGVEVGYDGWTVRGDFPPASFWGFEVKDRGYVGKFQRYDEQPEPVRFVNGRLAPVLRHEGASSFCSFEFRLNGDGRPYLIDPCLRCGSPPFEATMEGYANLSEILWAGARGEMVEPEPLGGYLAMAMIHAPFALTNWVPVEVPEEDRRWLKLRNAAVLGGKLYHVPVGGEMPEIGAVVAVEDSLEKAKEKVHERAERVQGYQLNITTDALDRADEEVTEARKYGVNFD